MIELNKDISENGLLQGFAYYSKHNKVTGKIKNKKDYRKKVRKYCIIDAILIFSFSSALFVGINTNSIKDTLLYFPFCLLFYYFFILMFDCNRRIIKRETILLERYLKNQPHGELEIWEFGINLFCQTKKVRDISWGNISSIAQYDDIIMFYCKISKCSFFINSEYENEVKKALENQNMSHLFVDKRGKGEVK